MALGRIAGLIRKTLFKFGLIDSSGTPIGGADADAIHDNVAGEIAAITEKVSPVNADLVIIEDSADSNNKKRVQVGNLPGGGGGGSGSYDVIVDGVSPATVDAALALGHHRIRLSADVTEVGAVNILDNDPITIDLDPGVTWDLDDNLILQGAFDADIEVEGLGPNATLQLSRTTAGNADVFGNNSLKTSDLTLRNLTVDARTGYTSILNRIVRRAAGARITFQDTTWLLPNQNTILLNQLNGHWSFTGRTRFDGGGTSCFNFLTNPDGFAMDMDDAELSGSFSTTTSLRAFVTGRSFNCNKLRSTSTTGMNLKLEGNVSNIQDTQQQVRIETDGLLNIVNARGDDNLALLSVTLTGSPNVYFSNVHAINWTILGTGQYSQCTAGAFSAFSASGTYSFYGFTAPSSATVTLNGTGKLYACDFTGTTLTDNRTTSLGVGNLPSTLDGTVGPAARGFATVAPTGADYTTVEAAINAGETDIRVTASVTESTTITFPDDTPVVVDLGDAVVWDLADEQFDGSGESRLVVRGQGYTSASAGAGSGRSEITYSGTSGNLFISASGWQVDLSDLLLDVNTTNATRRFTSIESLLNFERIEIQCPNLADFFMTVTTDFHRWNVVDCIIQGGGTGCGHVFNDGGTVDPNLRRHRFDRVEFGGTWSTSTSIVALRSSKVMQCSIDSVAAKNFNFGGDVDGFYFTGLGGILMNADTTARRLDFSDATAGATLSIGADCKVTQSYLQHISGWNDRCVVSDSDIVEIFPEIDGPDVTLIGCRITNDFSCLLAGARAKVIGCTVGATGGGTITVDLNSTAIVTNNHATVTDNSGGSAVVANNN